MRKAVVLFMAMLFCGGLSVYAEARPIHIVQKPSDGSNTISRWNKVEFSTNHLVK